VSSDERLALRAAQGDERAFGEIYERYHQELYRFCVAMVGNPQDAQDALQNAMVKVLRALPGEKRAIKLKPWLYRIARNESVEVLRRRRDSVELEPEQATTPGVAETAETRERLRTLLADLERLPERQRAALLLRELSGLDFAEIGTAFGSSAAVARQTLYEARLSLRQLEAGREMRCADVMRELSDADGRVARRRDIRAHLRDCADCRAFRDGIAERRADLAAIAPLPVAASAGLLHVALGQAGASGAGTAGGGLAGAVGAGAGKAVATSAIVKSAVAVAAVAFVGVSAAGRSGLIDVPLATDGSHDSTAGRVQPRPSAATGDATGGTPGSQAPDGTVSAERHPGGGASDANRSKAERAGSTGPQTEASQTEDPSGSRAGLSPPGGGYGRSAAERKGRPEQAPTAAEHGQQTAAAHKPTKAASPPGGGAGEGHGKPSAEAGSKPNGTATAHEPPGTTAPPASQAHGEAVPRGGGGPAEPGADAAPPGHER
jgi:RNA polymerase sigma factor (sigma-70 family)